MKKGGTCVSLLGQCMPCLHKILQLENIDTCKKDSWNNIVWVGVACHAGIFWLCEPPSWILDLVTVKDWGKEIFAKGEGVKWKKCGQVPYPQLDCRLEWVFSSGWLWRICTASHRSHKLAVLYISFNSWIKNLLAKIKWCRCHVSLVQASP